MCSSQTGEHILEVNEMLVLLELKGDKVSLPWRKCVVTNGRYLHVLGDILLSDLTFHFNFTIYECQCAKCHVYKTGTWSIFRQTPQLNYHINYAAVTS